MNTLVVFCVIFVAAAAAIPINIEDVDSVSAPSIENNLGASYI